MISSIIHGFAAKAIYLHQVENCSSIAVEIHSVCFQCFEKNICMYSVSFDCCYLFDEKTSQLNRKFCPLCNGGAQCLCRSCLFNLSVHLRELKTCPSLQKTLHPVILKKTSHAKQKDLLTLLRGHENALSLTQSKTLHCSSSFLISSFHGVINFSSHEHLY